MSLHALKSIVVLSSLWLVGHASGAIITSASTFGLEVGSSSYVVGPATLQNQLGWVDAACGSGAGVIVGDCSRLTTAVTTEVTFGKLAPIIIQFGAVTGGREDQYTDLEFLLTNRTGSGIYNLLLETGYITSQGFQPHQFGDYGGAGGYLPSFGFSTSPSPFHSGRALDWNSGVYGHDGRDLWLDEAQMRGKALLGTPDSSLTISGQVYPFAVRLTPNADITQMGQDVPEPASYALIALGLAQLLFLRRHGKHAAG